MTDMRATERLLEVIEERCEAIERGWRDGYKINVDEFRGLVEFVVETKHEIAELRRRGDTLVHKEDLAIVVACARLEVDDPPPRVAYYEGLERATESLERAIKDP